MLLLAAVAGVVVVYFPVGFSVLLGVVITAFLCPPVERFDMSSSGFALAEFWHRLRFVALRPWYVFRLGPQKGNDGQFTDKENGPTMWTPVSHSAVAAFVTGGLTAGLDWMLSFWLSSLYAPPVLGDVAYLPYVDLTGRVASVTVAGSAVCGWWVAQLVAYARRGGLFSEENAGMGFGAPPASVITGGLRGGARAVLLSGPAVSVGVAVAGLGTAAWYFGVVYATGVGPLVVVGLFVSAAVLVAAPLSRSATEQHKEWLAEQEERRQWRLRWSFIKGLGIVENQAPNLSIKAEYPRDNPTHVSWLFRLQPGTKFENFAGAMKPLASTLSTQHIVIERHRTPHGDQDLRALKLTHELEGVVLPSNPHLDSSLDNATREFAVRCAVINAFADSKLPTPMFVSMDVISAPKQPQIVKTAWRLFDGLTYDEVATKTEKLRELLKCEWCRPYQPEGTDYLGLAFGVRATATKLKRPEEAHFKKLQEIDWSYLMRQTGLLGTDGRTAELVSTRPAALGLMELTFSYAPGQYLEAVAQHIEPFKPLSGYQHIELEEHPTDPKQFILRVGATDPLGELYFFKDFKDEILRKPVRGEPFTDWAVGMKSSGELAYYQWEGEEPHLLVAASTGQGKSAVINTMMCQMLHNNHPDDINFWLIEPKTELQAYQHMAHTTRFLDLNSTSDPQHDALAMLLQEGVNEMEYRNRTFSAHRRRPQKLSEAREIAKRDPEGSSELNFPYIFIVIEECATYFANPDKDEKEAAALVKKHALRLAREARSAGIHLCIITQYPTKENVPVSLKTQCRRIGLGVNNVMASMVIIDQKGLEKITTKGRGKVSSGKGYADFRGLLLDRVEAKGIDHRGDILDVLPTNMIWPKLSEGVTPNDTYVASTRRGLAEQQAENAAKAAVADERPASNNAAEPAVDESPDTNNPVAVRDLPQPETRQREATRLETVHLETDPFEITQLEMPHVDAPPAEASPTSSNETSRHELIKFFVP